jgi:hypothetical protein
MSLNLMLPEMKTLVLPVRPEGTVVPQFDSTLVPKMRQDDECLNRMASVMRRIGESQDKLQGSSTPNLYAPLDAKLQECLDLARALESTAYTAIHAEAAKMFEVLGVRRKDILEVDQCVARFGDLLHYELKRVRYLQYCVSFTTGEACLLLEGNYVDAQGIEHRDNPIEVRLTPDSVIRILKSASTET